MASGKEVMTMNRLSKEAKDETSSSQRKSLREIWDYLDKKYPEINTQDSAENSINKRA
jgi:hypothetical protein